LRCCVRESSREEACTGGAAGLLCELMAGGDRGCAGDANRACCDGWNRDRGLLVCLPPRTEESKRLGCGDGGRLDLMGRLAARSSNRGECSCCVCGLLGCCVRWNREERVGGGTPLPRWKRVDGELGLWLGELPTSRRNRFMRGLEGCSRAAPGRRIGSRSNRCLGSLLGLIACLGKRDSCFVCECCFVDFLLILSFALSFLPRGFGLSFFSTDVGLTGF